MSQFQHPDFFTNPAVASIACASLREQFAIVVNQSTPEAAEQRRLLLRNAALLMEHSPTAEVIGLHQEMLKDSCARIDTLEKGAARNHMMAVIGIVIGVLSFLATIVLGLIPVFGKGR